MKVVVSVVLVALFCLAKPVYANSYLQMLTTPPAGSEVATDADEETDYFSDDVYDAHPRMNLWYKSKLVTSAPIEVSRYPKYKAWLQAQKNQDSYDFGDTKEKLQTALYAVEGILVALGIYMFYKK